MDLSKLTNILFLDIETVSRQGHFNELDERFQKLWTKKASILKSEAIPEVLYKERAAIYAEFGRILVIGVGQFVERKGELSFKTRAFSSASEGDLPKLMRL